MTQDHRLQRQRFELKYFVEEARTAAIRDFLSSYLELDEYGSGQPGGAYAVHSVYLDSPDLETFHLSVNGVKNRYKLRMRYYDDRPDTPVFFEIKSRVDNCMFKQRCPVRRSAVGLLLEGYLPEPDHALSAEPRHLVALQEFHLHMQRIGARPKVHNAYLREAWVSHGDNSVRVTFDRQVRIEPWSRNSSPTEMSHAALVFPVVILEIKFTNRFPNWMQDLVRQFHLMRGSASKYAEGVLTLGEYAFQDSERVIHSDYVAAADRFEINNWRAAAGELNGAAATGFGL